MVIGFPSGPAAVPDFVWRSDPVRFWFSGENREGKHTTLANTGEENLCEDFVTARDWDGVVYFKLDVAAEVAYKSDGLGLGDGD